MARAITIRLMAAPDGPDYIMPDGVNTAALAELRHGVVLKPEADLQRLTSDLISADSLKAVEVPK